MAVKVKSSGGGEEPKKDVKVKVKPTTKQLEEATKLAQRLAKQHGAFNAENIHTGGEIPKFYDESGADITNVPPPQVGNLTSKVPSYVKSLEWDSKANLPYFVDQTTGYMQYVPKELFYSARFNPQKGKETESIISFAKLKK
ncbi:MAG TPA: hypothetical protein PKV73_01160 [Agriterribacter sp.]|nr:hypothetical protein [Agriterribacter sp.]